MRAPHLKSPCTPGCHSWSSTSSPTNSITRKLPLFSVVSGLESRAQSSKWPRVDRAAQEQAVTVEKGSCLGTKGFYEAGGARLEARAGIRSLGRQMRGSAQPRTTAVRPRSSPATPGPHMCSPGFRVWGCRTN